MGNATSISNKCFLHLTLHCRSTEISYLDNYRYQATALIENRPTNMLFLDACEGNAGFGCVSRPR